MERLGLFYTRFMDDVLVPAPTRRRLRGAVKTVNRVLGAVDLRSTRTRRSSAGSNAASTFSATISV